MCGPCGILPNFALWGMAYPYNFISHMGGRYQACTMPFDWTPQQAFGVRNIFNPMYHMFSFMGALQNNLYGSYNQNYNIQNAMMFGMNFGMNYGVDTNIGNTVGQVGKFIDDINSGIASGKLTEEQKAKMEQLKREAEAIQRRLQDLQALKTSGANLSQVQQILSQINSDFRDLKAKAQELANEIKEAQKNGGSSSSSSSSNEEDNDVSANEPTTKEKYDAKQICNKLDKAIIGAGTNYDDDEDGLLPVMKKINADNVMNVINTWDESYAKYGAYAEDKKGFIESLMDDCEGHQKEDIATLLIDALEKRALNLGIDVDSEVGQARMSAHANWIGWRDDDKICDAVNALIDKVREGSKTKKAE